MSWALNKIGRASKLAETIKKAFEETGGCPVGTAEESAKNALGGVAEALCKSFAGNPVVKIGAHGSAWNTDKGANTQSAHFEFSTIGEIEE